MATPADMISVAEAAKLLKVSTTRVREYITSNRLPATKVGRAYVLRRSDVTSFERLDWGRPPKSKE